jgi:DNA repair protein RecN (Recombination protein N)
LLSYLRVRDLALIEDVEVEFGPGFNALTGETGAGKTVLVGAIGLLLGGRADSTWIRHGTQAALLSCSFDISSLPHVALWLSEAGYTEDGESELVLTRVIQAGGKNRCSLNGRLCPVSTLSSVGERMLDVHGQNEHQALIRPATHIGYLDRFAGGEHQRMLTAYRAAYRELKEAGEERDSVPSGPEAEREAALLEAELAEVERLSPEPGEIEDLEARALKMRAARDLITRADMARNLLSGGENRPGAREMLLEAAMNFSVMSQSDPAVEELAKRTESISIEAEDIAAAANAYLKDLDEGQGTLEEVESRLSDLRALARRFSSLEEALERARVAAARLEELRSAVQRAADLDGKIASLTAGLVGKAADISASRKRAAGRLEVDVAGQLEDLELTGAFEVEVGRRQGEPGPGGSDEVQFMFSPSDEPARPLTRIASGGEMSRVMLALKIVLAAADEIPVLVFDEVDAGIGGETAGRVGEKLLALTAHHQVFCVTHLPQIASYSDVQYRVYKGELNGSQRTFIEKLDPESRVDEICRMLGDSSGRKATTAHARDLLKRASDSRKAVL